MSAGLRNKVYDALNTDPQIVATLAGGNVYPNFAVDSPANTITRWIILRWGPAEPPLGRDTSARGIVLTIAAFDRESDFTRIDLLLRRTQTVLRALEAQPTGGGYVIGVSDPAGNEDAWDDGYSAVVRSETYRIVATGF